MMSASDVIDLTLDSDEDEDNEIFNTPLNTLSSNRTPNESQAKAPFNMQNLKQSEEELASQTKRIASMDISKNSRSPEISQFDLSSPEILALSPFRKVKRLPDLICMEQKRGINKLTHRKLMEAEIKLHSPGSPDIMIENEVDKDWAPPFHFCYVNDYLLDEKLKSSTKEVDDYLTVSKGCGCDEGFCSPQTCDCRKIHTTLAQDYYLKFPKDQFAYQSDGLLHPDVLPHEDMPIWECNKDCSCGGDCQNNVVSKGRKVGLIIFKHAKKGWCVKLAEDVKAGQFIEIYAGELITAAEANTRNAVYSRLNNTYVMDITPYHVKWQVFAEPYLRKKGKSKEQYIKEKLQKRQRQDTGEERSDIIDNLVEKSEKKCEEDPLLAIDGTLFGNITRYLAHSCEPNLIRHMVHTYERDIRRPFVAYFAKENLKAGQEITMHYDGLSEHKFDGQKSQLERLETMKCYCDKPTCSGFVFKGRDLATRASM